MVQQRKTTDSIPRVSMSQVLGALSYLARSEQPSTFEGVRVFLHQQSGRRAPQSREALWTAARDTLSDLQRLGFVRSGSLPRKRSDVQRLSGSPCELTDRGASLATLYHEDRGRALDQLLLTWLNEHPYFRAYTSRLLRGPLHVPDITSMRQLGTDALSQQVIASLAERITASCLERLAPVGFSDDKSAVFSRSVLERVDQIRSTLDLGDLDTKRWVDAIEDLVVLPSFFAAEGLPFDSVSFQHLIKASQDFLSGAWTSSHPDFDGRVVFATCDFEPDPREAVGPVHRVVYHGRTYAAKVFNKSLVQAYRRLTRVGATYVNAYAVRALVCVELRIQPQVFAACLRTLLAAGSVDGLTVFTELPFEPPPAGETHIEPGPRRIGRLKLVPPSGV
jgi:hypothetical protein